MKNLQKLAVALLVGIMAIGFSAFKSAETSNSKLAPFYYGLNEARTDYVLVSSSSNPTGECTQDGDDPCVISYPTSQGTSFSNDPEEIPANGTPSETLGYIE